MANEFVVKNGLITPTVQLPGATSGTVTLSAPAVAGTTTIALPATAGTIVTTGDTGTVTNAMLAGSIANDKLVNNTISGTALGGTLPTATFNVSGTGLSGSATYNGTTASTFTVTSNATSANTVSTIVSRDASGNFSAGTITAALNGNASTASTLQTARTITLSGDVAGSVSFNGSTDVSITATIQPDSVALGTDTTGNYVATVAVSGTGLSVSGSGVESAAVTVTSNATNANTASTIVARDASGNFSAGTITAALSGNASTASALQTARTISLTGDVTGSVSFDGSGNAAIATTIQPDSVALGTDTTGNYMVNVAAGTGVSVSHTQGEGSTATVSIGQAVGTTDNVTFNNVTVNGTLNSDDITSTNISVSGNATITGNLTVSGTTTTVNSTTISIADANIELARNATTAAQANGAGLTVTGPTTAATLTYTSADDRWNFNKNLNVGTVFGALSGNSTTATTLQTARTINGVSFDGSANISFNTSSVSEGTNLYYTDTRARAALSFTAGSGAYNSSTGVITIPTNTNQLTNGAGFITGYTETDTLATVTGRGASTSTRSTFNGGWTVPDTTVNYVGNFQTTDYSTFTFMSRAWSSVQGTNGLAYTFNTHNNAGGGGYGALQIYYGEGGKVEAPTSFRSPIFYDSNDTSYYIDPASTSRIRKTNLIASGSGWDDGLNLYSADATNRWNLLVDEGASDSFRIAYNNSEAFNINTSRNVTIAVSLQAPVGTFTNDGSSRVLYLKGSGNIIQFQDADGTNRWENVGRNGEYYVYKGYGTGSGYKWQINDSGEHIFTGISTFVTDVRSPIFYDSNNTGFYVDPNSTSNLQNLTVNNSFTAYAPGSSSAWNSLTFYSSTEWGDGTSYGVLGGESGDGIMLRRPHIVWNADQASADIRLGRSGGVSGGQWINFGIKGSNVGFIGVENTNVLTFSGASSRITAVNGVDAPIFYDSNDTNWYVDPNGNSRLNQLGVGSNNTSFTFYNNGTSYFNGAVTIDDTATFTAGNQLQFYTSNGSLRGYINATDTDDNHLQIATSGGEDIVFKDAGLSGTRNLVIRGGNTGTEAYGSMRSPIFYDSGNTSYYVDPADGGFNLRGGTSNRVTYTTNDSGFRVNNPEGNGVSDVRLGAAWGYPGVYSSTYLMLGSENYIEFRTQNVQRGYIDNSANLYALGSMRSPIFYNYSDTNYYLDPDSYSFLNSVSVNVGNESTGAGNGSTVGLTLRGNYNSNSWAHKFHKYDNGGGVPLYLSYTSGASSWIALQGWGSGLSYTSQLFGSFAADSAVFSPIFYDKDNTAYWGDFNSISKMYSVQAENLGGAVLNRVTSNIGVATGYREAITFIDGSTVQAHVSTKDGSGNCYQWYTTEWIYVDPEKDYEFSFWVRSDGTANIYFGWNEHDGSGNTISSNPYFSGGAINTNSTWVKRTALLRNWRTPSSTGDTNGSDRYASTTSRNSGPDVQDGVMHSATRRVQLRFGTCYGGTSSGQKTYFHLASIREVTGHDRQTNILTLPYFNGSNYSGSMNFRTFTHWESISGIDLIGGSGEFRMSSDSGQLNLRVDGWMYAYDNSYFPLIYDQQDTGYYFDGNSTTRTNVIQTNYIGVNQAYNSSWPLIVNGNAYLNGGGYGQAEGSWRAPIFYDSNDTGYYLDPNSITSIRTVGSWRSDSSTWDGEFSGKIQYHNSYWYFQAASGWFFRNSGGTNVASIDNSGTISGNYIMGTYFNSSAGNSENPTIGQIWTQSTSDNYLRKSTVAHFRSQVIDGSYLKLYGTVNNNIDSDYGECSITFDPVPSGTPPISSPNIRTLNLGNDFNRRTQLAFDYASNRAWFRRRNEGGWSGWLEFYHTGNLTNLNQFTNGPGYITSVSFDGLTAKTSGTGTYQTSGDFRAPIFYDSDDTAYYLDPANTLKSAVLNGNVEITPRSSSWAEGIQFYMPNQSTWGGLRWVRNRSNYHGSWYIGWTALDSTNDLVFGTNASGTQVDNILRLYNSASGSARISRDLYISGNTGGNYGNRLIIGNTDTSYTLQDTNLRPTLHLHGQYPVVSLNHTVTSNINHGPTLQFTNNGTGYQFVIGTNGTGTILSMGYANATDWNPHNGIAGYNGTSFFQAGTNGYIGIGTEGDWGVSGGIGTHVPGYNLHFIGNINGTNGHAAFFDARSAAGNGSGFLFRNLQGNHSWGIVAEYRIEGTVGTDRPSILFSQGYNSNTWSVGFGYTDDTFKIKYDHGHRNAGWGTTALEIDRSSNVIATGSSRAPIFYDSNDTNYFVDPAGNTWLSGNLTLGTTLNPVIKFHIRQSSSSTTAVDSGMSLLNDNGTVGCATGIRFSTYADQNGGVYAKQYIGGVRSASGSGHGPLVFCNRNAADNTLVTLADERMRIDPTGFVQASVDFRSPIYYDSGNTGYYVDAAATGTSVNVAGSIIAAGNVTAYSDIRLKTNIRTIDNAIDKIKKIRGVTFDRTDNPDLPRQAGVIAQEVKEVLPEVVSGSEESKYTVAYGNMVGLLIEAIKEQQSEIDELKALVRQLLAK